MKKMILSRRLVKARAAMLDMTLEEVNAAAGYAPGTSYIYRALGKDSVYLSTIYKIATALGCDVCDVLEEVEAEEDEPDAPAPAAGTQIPVRRLQTWSKNMPAVDPDAISDDTKQAEAKRREALLAQAAQRAPGHE